LNSPQAVTDRSPYPVIAVNGLMDITNPLSSETCGRLHTVLAMGSQAQVATWRLHRAAVEVIVKHMRRYLARRRRGWVPIIPSTPATPASALAHERFSPIPMPTPLETSREQHTLVTVTTSETPEKEQKELNPSPVPVPASITASPPVDSPASPPRDELLAMTDADGSQRYCQVTVLIEEARLPKQLISRDSDEDVYFYVSYNFHGKGIELLLRLIVTVLILAH